ncbi:hypothetical protein ACWDTT_15735, partial [Streptosporangium sandarakinum]
DRMGVTLEELPEDRVTLFVTPAEMRVGNIHIAVDLPGLLAQTFRPAWEADRRFEQASDRWRKQMDRVSGYIPSDVGSIRWSVLPADLFEEWRYDQASEYASALRVNHAQGAAWAYMATPHFIPADLALDVVTATPPPPEARSEIRLPSRYCLLVHDGVPLPVISGDEPGIDAWETNALIHDQALLLGAVLAANDDGSLFEQRAYLIIARPDPRRGIYGWQTVMVPHGDHAAGRVLLNYASLLSWEGWAAPPELPTTGRGKPGSRNQLKKLARTPEAAQGAWHGVRVLDYRPPAEDAVERPATRGSGRQLRYQSKRRGYWKPRVRYGIRDENGQLVGPVYKDGAIEGETYVRVRRFIRRTVVRDDLPEPPSETVYKVPSGVRRG